MSRKPERLCITRQNPPAYNPDEVDRLINEAFETQGWLITDESGDVWHDMDKARHALFLAFTSNHAVTAVAAGRSRRELADLIQDRAVTKYALYIELFPNGPAATAAPASDEEQVAKDHIADQLWRWSTTTNRNAWLQKALTDSGLVVLETKKFSSNPEIPSLPGRYVTDVESMMLDFIENKVIADVQKKVGEMDQWLATMMLRNPEIALPAARKAKALLKAAVESAHHANPTFVRETLAIGGAPVTGGNAEDDSTED